MVYRNTAADSGRKGAPSQTRKTTSSPMTVIPPKGEFLPAYGGGMGKRDDEGAPEDEPGATVSDRN